MIESGDGIHFMHQVVLSIKYLTIGQIQVSPITGDFCLLDAEHTESTIYWFRTFNSANICFNVNPLKSHRNLTDRERWERRRDYTIFKSIDRLHNPRACYEFETVEQIDGFINERGITLKLYGIYKEIQLVYAFVVIPPESSSTSVYI